MVHHHFFMPKRADFTQEEFSNYYRRKHILAAGDQAPSALKRYLQSHRVAAPQIDAIFSAVAEVWYENEAAITGFAATEAYRKFRADELNFVDVARAENLTTVDHVVLDGERKRGQVKGMFLIKRKPGMTLADFRDYWLGTHGQIALKTPGLRRYVQCHTTDTVYHYCEPRWDGVAHVWFDDATAAANALSGDEFSRMMAEDTPKFAGLVQSLFVTEHILIWPRE
jgi:uncharacterized protein (TIGR02118 family)